MSESVRLYPEIRETQKMTGKTFGRMNICELILRSEEPVRKTSAYAAANDWLVLTSDDDFLTERQHHGLLFYHQLDKPSASDVVAAIQAIDEAYKDTSTAVEKVLGG